MGYVPPVPRPGSLARSRGIGALIVILAVEGALEVALRGDSVHEPGTSLWIAVPATALTVLALLGRRRYPFGAPLAVWAPGTAISFYDGRLVVRLLGRAVDVGLGREDRALQRPFGRLGPERSYE